ncbi:MAG: hypothetical protein JO327_10580 [Nitrososphaeraceae archaeon]|nr:hypothetical protein [Nitrososphaeraceae archaeon]MBV9668561.1 hypothetical protein [Nitrososphaeraceae archaeon]
MAARNVISEINGKSKRRKFDYKTKGMMMEIRKEQILKRCLGPRSKYMNLQHDGFSVLLFR